MVFEILISESEPTAARSFQLPLPQQMVKKATPKPPGKSWITSCEQCHLENVTLTEDKVLLLHSLCFCMCFRANSNIKCLLLKEQFISLNTFFHRLRPFTHFRTKKQYSIDAESFFVMQMTVLSLSVLKSQPNKGHRSMLKPHKMIDFFNYNSNAIIHLSKTLITRYILVKETNAWRLKFTAKLQLHPFPSDLQKSLMFTEQTVQGPLLKILLLTDFFP